MGILSRFSRYTLRYGVWALLIGLSVAGCKATGGSKASPNGGGGGGGSGTGGGAATIRISVPNGSSSAASSSAMASSTSSSAMSSSLFASSSGGPNGQYAVPTSLGEFNCFAVNVIAEDIGSVSACGGDARMGVTAGFVPRGGGVVRLNVPFGRRRIFQVWGFANSVSCPDVLSLINLPKGTLPGGTRSPGFLLAQKEFDINSREMNISIGLDYVFGQTPVMCGGVPAPRTTVNFAKLANGPTYTPVTGGSTTSSNTDLCVGFTTTAVAPTFTCTQSITSGGVTTSGTVACGSTVVAGCPSNPGGYVYKIPASGLVAATQVKTLGLTINTTDGTYRQSDPSPPTYSYTVDMEAPVLTMLGIVPGSLNALSTEYHTKASQPSFRVSITEAGSVTSRWAAGACTAPGAFSAAVTCNTLTEGGPFSCSLANAFGASGLYCARFTPTDSAGNAGTALNVTVRYDYSLTPAPTIALKQVDDSAVSSTSPATLWVMGGSFNTNTSNGIPEGMNSTVYNGVIPYATDTDGEVNFSTFMCDINSGRVDSSGNSLRSLTTCPANTAAGTTQVSFVAPVGTTQRGGLHTLIMRVADYAGWVSSLFNVNIYFDNLSDLPVLGRYNVITGKGISDESSMTRATPNLPGPTGLNFPGGVVLDRAGKRVFVADTKNNRVMIYQWDSTRNAVRSRKAIGVLGQPDFYTYSSDCTAAKMNRPVGLHVATLSDGARYLFVADSGNHRVLRYTLVEADGDIPSTATLLSGTTDVYIPANTAEYVFGQANLTSCTASNLADSRDLSKGFNFPVAVATYTTGSTDYLTVSDNLNCRVAMFNDAKTTVADPTIAAHAGTAGAAVADGVGAWTCNAHGHFTTMTYNVGDVAGTDNLEAPEGLAVDPDTGKLYVADMENNRAVAYQLPLGGAPAQIEVYGQGNATDDNITNYSTTGLGLPRGVAVIPVGTTKYIAVSDVGRVRLFQSGSSTPDFTWGSTTLGTSRSLMAYAGQIHYDSELYQLFVTDDFANRVLVYSAALIATGSATDVLGQTNSGGSSRSFSTYNLSTNALWDTAGINSPNDVNLAFPTYTVYDPLYSRLYVSDTFNNRVMVYSVDATTRRPLSNSAVAVLGVALKTDGDPMLDSPAGTPVEVTANTLSAPRGLAVDGSGRLWVADSGNDRIVRYPTNTANLASGIASDFVLYAANHNSQGTSANHDAPLSLAYDGVNNYLYVGWTNSAALNNRIHVWALTTTQTGAVNPTASFGGTGAASASTVGAPANMYFTSGSGTPIKRGLFVADSTYNRVLYYNLDPATTPVNGVPASPGAGQATVCYGHRSAVSAATACTNSTAYDGGAITNGYGLSAPQGVFYDETGRRLFVSDTGSNRVLVYDMSTNSVNDPFGTAIFYNVNKPYHAMGAINLGSKLTTPASSGLNTAITTSDSPAATAAGLNKPMGILLLTPTSGTKNLYIVDEQWHRVGVYEVP